MSDPSAQHLDEAEQLAERVAVIDGGTIVAQGTPGSLGGRDRAAVEVGSACGHPGNRTICPSRCARPW
jgi:ABC-2 type transport system ATP-binding protein